MLTDEQRKRNQVDSALRGRYGVTLEEYEDKLAEQGGTCALCDRLPKRQRLHLDHDHRTGEFRGVLCGLCNAVVGLIEAHPVWLSRVVKYLHFEGKFG